MPNYNYQKGRKKEYKIMNAAKDLNHISFRSAGSHGKIDVVDIDVYERVIRFIQCKPDTMSEKAKQRLRDENNLLNGAFQCRFEVV